MPAINSPELLITDWLANNFSAWEVTQELRDLAALFDIDIDAIIGTGVRVEALDAFKVGTLWYDSGIEDYESRTVYAVVSGAPVDAVILHVDIDIIRAQAWAERERFRQLHTTAD
jgi:hypothetical protein